MVKVDMRKVIIYCACDGEAIRLEPDDYEEGLFHNTCISMWERGIPKDGKTSWKHKLKLIKKILKDGTPYSDQVIIDQAGRKLLIQALQAYDTEEDNIIINTDTSCSENIVKL